MYKCWWNKINVYFNGFRKIKKTRLKVSQKSVTVLQIMANCQEARVKLTNTQSNKLKTAEKKGQEQC